MNSKELDEKVHQIKLMAQVYNLMIEGHDGIITVSGKFTPGDKNAYIEMENNAREILRQFRQVRPGTTWGTDSGSVGGAIGLEKGYVTLHKSGCEKRLASKFGR